MGCCSSTDKANGKKDAGVHTVPTVGVLEKVPSNKENLEPLEPPPKLSIENRQSRADSLDSQVGEPKTERSMSMYHDCSDTFEVDLVFQDEGDGKAGKPEDKDAPRETSVVGSTDKSDSVNLEWINKLFKTDAKDYSALPTSAFSMEVTEKQLEVAKKLREHFPESLNFHSDADIVRFCKARNFVWKDILIMYTKYNKEFRNSNVWCAGMPFVRPALGPEFENLQPDEPDMSMLVHRPLEQTLALERIRDCFMHNVIFRVDRVGRPVLYNKMATPINRGIGDIIPIEDRLRWHAAMYEQLQYLLLLCSKRTGKYIGSVTSVIDVSGSTFSGAVKHMRRADTKVESDFMSDFFPERMAKIVVVNAPMGANTAWNMAKVLLPAATAEKVTILGTSGYSTELLKLISEENLPVCYGGQAKFEYPELQDIDSYKPNVKK